MCIAELKTRLDLHVGYLKLFLKFYKWTWRRETLFLSHNVNVFFPIFSGVVVSVESFPLSRSRVPSDLYLHKKVGVKFLIILLCL